jgi:nuclear transport factor 2 (NTF2) superfamily protein
VQRPPLAHRCLLSHTRVQFSGNRIALRFAYEWHDDPGLWYRSCGNENSEFNNDGLMTTRFASINDCRFWNQSASITGRSGVVPMTIRD